jgi:hypothetical protein
MRYESCRVAGLPSFQKMATLQPCNLGNFARDAQVAIFLKDGNLGIPEPFIS